MEWTFRIGVEANRELALWLWAFDLLGFAFGLFVLVLRPAQGWRRELWRIVVFAAGLGALTLAVTLLRWSHGHGFFFFLRILVHAIICVSAPTLLLRAWRLRTALRGLAWTYAVMAVVAVVLWLYAHAIEPYRLETKIETLAMERGPSRPLRVLLLADIQTDRGSDFEAEVLKTSAELRPDLVLLAGDMIQTYGPERAGEVQALRDLFEAWSPKPPLGIFAVDGDADRATEVFAGTDVKPLVDDWVDWPELSLQVLGLSLPASRRPLTAADQDRIEQFRGLTIVMGHAPDFTKEWAEGTVDIPALAVAGHTHGGQVQLPGYGPPVTLTKAPRAVAGGALTPAGRGMIRVSRGIGMERGAAPRLRFRCRPEIVLFEIPAKAP